MRRPTDEAVSDTIGVVLMVGIAVVMAATVWIFVGGSSAGTAAPPAIGLVQKDNVIGGTASYTVASVSGNPKWGDLSLTADSTKLVYDGALSGSSKFCVQDGASGCIATGAWDPKLPVKAGQILFLHDPSLDFGSKFNLVHDTSNTQIAALKVK